MHADPGSFRDRDSKVLYDDRGVLRGLSERGLADWRALESSALYSRFSESGQLVGSELIDADSFQRNGWAALLRHERVPFVSYPYEWTFSMLKDAALLQLDLTLAALDEELMLKDGSPYNVQWRGTKPVFIDVGSFERLRARRTVGGLPAVLHALSLSTAPGVVPWPVVSAVASWLARGNRAGCLSPDAPPARSDPAGRSWQCRRPLPAAAGQRRPRQRNEA